MDTILFYLFIYWFVRENGVTNVSRVDDSGPISISSGTRPTNSPTVRLTIPPAVNFDSRFSKAVSDGRSDYRSLIADCFIDPELPDARPRGIESTETCNRKLRFADSAVFRQKWSKSASSENRQLGRIESRIVRLARQLLS